MKIKNKEMLLYSMNKAIEEAKYAMEETEKKEDEVYYRVGTALHWIVDCFDRIEVSGISISLNDKEFRTALHAANNLLKHRPELLKLHKRTGGSRLPVRLSFHTVASYYVWKNIDKVPLNNEKQKESYRPRMEGKDIRLTFQEAKSIIEGYFKQDK